MSKNITIKVKKFYQVWVRSKSVEMNANLRTDLYLSSARA